MIGLDPARVVSLVASDDEIGPQAAEEPSPAWPAAPAKTAFDASLEPLLQELEAEEAGADGVEDDEEPTAPPSEDEDARLASVAQILDSFMIACGRPEELREEAKPEAGTQKARPEDTRTSQAGMWGGDEAAGASRAPGGASVDVARPATRDATIADAADRAAAPPVEAPPSPERERASVEARPIEAPERTSVGAVPGDHARQVEAPSPEREKARVDTAPRDVARPIEAKASRDRARASVETAARDDARQVEAPASPERARSLVDSASGDVARPAEAPASPERARAVDSAVRDVSRPASLEPARAPVEATPQDVAQASTARDVAPVETRPSPRSPQDAPPPYGADMASRPTAAPPRVAATKPHEDADVGRRRSAPPVAELPPSFAGEVSIPLAADLAPPARAADVGGPTAGARISSSVMDLTLVREADGALERAVRAVESMGHRRALAEEARGRIVAPELGAVEVVARLERDARVDVVVRAEEQQGRDAIAAARPELVAHVRAEVPRVVDVHVEGAQTTSASASNGERRDGGREAPPREPREDDGPPDFVPVRRLRARFVL